MTVERGATPAEESAARVKADALTAKYGLKEAPSRARSQARPRPAPPVNFKGWRGGTIFAPFEVPRFEFDAQTGKSSKNVKVHHHRNRGNWRIEIFPNE